MYASEEFIYVEYDFRTLIDKVRQILSSHSVRLPRLQPNMRTVKVPCSGSYSAILSNGVSCVLCLFVCIYLIFLISLRWIITDGLL